MEERERRIASLRELVALIREDLRHNGGLGRPGALALVVHRFGVWKHGIRTKILRVPCTVLYRLANGFVRNFYGIELFISTRVGRRVLIGHQHGITLHANAVIGDDCSIIHGVTIGQTQPTPGLPPPPAPKLGNRVRVGAFAVIAGDITIGDDVIIGPNTVVLTNVPAGSMVIAPPSRIMPRMPARKPKPKPAATAPEDIPAPAEAPADEPEAKVTRKTGT